ncbi:MAG: hypothetical protein NT136_01740 [Candidatus Moranbacteria bacterium]|nr:hypothetical protein [Candidatus Moranbacteria bacterium]
MKNENQNESEITEAEKTHKIQSLREMIMSAEKTIQGAKAMLLQLEGKKKTGRKRKSESKEGDGTIIEGTFDGQIMIGIDGKQYPVPANYASKSKLVEGDMLKLTITPDGSFIYKQIGPVERRHAIGIASQDERGNYYVIAEGNPYRILLASTTYYKVEPGDEVAIVVPRFLESSWAAIENVIKKGKDKSLGIVSRKFDIDKEIESLKEEVQMKNGNEPATAGSQEEESVADEWTTDIKEVEEEIKNEQQ